MSKAAQGFSPEAYLQYVEGGNPRPPARRAYASVRERRSSKNSHLWMGANYNYPEHVAKPSKLLYFYNFCEISGIERSRTYF